LLGVLLVTLCPAGAAPVASTAEAPLTITGSWRLRVEDWDWFQGTAGDGDYTFTGSLLRLALARTLPTYDGVLELAQVTLLDLPENAVAPPPQGALGLGANYRAANGEQDGSLFIKQGFVRLKALGGTANSLRLGRFEFIEGTEVAPKDATLAALKRERIAHRLLGNFAFSHVGRSVDGVHLVRDTPSLNTTLLTARVTEGVFQLNAMNQMRVRVLYAALTKPMPSAKAPGDGRLFWLHYLDSRGVAKVDNRPAAERNADRQNISLHTVGGHYLKKLPAGEGAVDLLAWGVYQFGDWGQLDHRANAWTAEIGYQPPKVSLRPWLRAGYFRGSGDPNGADGRNETFFQVLPTPRLYARTPFYNLMNNEDLFAQLILRPGKRLTARADWHRLRLTEAGDLWYSGGGAYQNNRSFGYSGRPSGGSRDLATMVDLSLDYQLSPQTTISLYGGLIDGGDVPAAIYTRDEDMRFAYVEMLHRW
jgi:hypothetical protein